MKKCVVFGIALLFIMTNFKVNGQENIAPVYILNNQEIDYTKTYINSYIIDSIGVTRNTTFGEISIFTKNREISFYSLTDVKLKFTDLGKAEKEIVYKINGDIISDTTVIRIDKSFFIYTNTDQISDVNYLSEDYGNLIILNIDLESEKRKTELRIRNSMLNN